MPVALRDLLSKLEFLSMIKQNLKPCLGDMTFVEANTLYGAIKRAFKGEGSNGMLLYVNQTIEQTVEFIEDYKDTEFFSIIIEKLANARIGIANLAITYTKENQPSVVSRINVILSNVDLTLKKYKNVLEGKTEK
jgi:hypothetical protein